MNGQVDSWKPLVGCWSLEQAITYLAFGNPGEPIVPEKTAETTAQEWQNLRLEREESSLPWVRRLEKALNDREIQACGTEIPCDLWSCKNNILDIGIALEDRAVVERTVRGKGNKSRFRLSIDPLFRHVGAGITLVLKDDVTGYMVKLYCMVDLPETKIRQFKRRFAADRAGIVGEPTEKRTRGRPPIARQLMEIYREREKLGKAFPRAIDEAKACCDLYKKENEGDVVNPETLARKIGKERKDNFLAP